jgi:hypothetical protein
MGYLPFGLVVGLKTRPLLFLHDTMAKDKKSFLLYTDLIHTLDKMPNEKAGELFKHILMYVNDMNPETDDLIIQLTFEPIKQQLKRDLQRYEKTCLKNKENGAKGGRPKNPQKANESDGFLEEPKKPDNDIDNDTDIDNDKDKEKKFNFSQALLSYGFDKNLISEWLEVRRKKKAVNTETAYKGFIKEVEKTNLDKNKVLQMCVEKSWQGFTASWITEKKAITPPNMERMKNDDRFL